MVYAANPLLAVRYVVGITIAPDALAQVAATPVFATTVFYVGFRAVRTPPPVPTSATTIVRITAKHIISGGLVSVGLVSLGVLSLGALLSIGAISVGTISIGAVAVGVFTIGALSVGMFSLGACSVASHIAIGDYANGHIAIGRITNGAKCIEVEESNRIFIEISKEQVRSLINAEYPKMWQWVTNTITGLFK